MAWIGLVDELLKKGKHFKGFGGFFCSKYRRRVDLGGCFAYGENHPADIMYFQYCPLCGEKLVLPKQKADIVIYE